MYTFGEKSLIVRKTLHPKLQLILDHVIKIVDISLIEGLRDKGAQNTYYAEGKSKVQFPFSKHNRTSDETLERSEYEVSDAVDLVPYPSLYTDNEQMVYVVGIVKGISHMLGIEIRVGADWNGDGVINNKKDDFFDVWHIELK